MRDSNELFDLCKQVYEATGWDGTEKFWHSLISHDMKTWSDYKLQDYKPDNLFGIRIVPLYTSDYLLENLPLEKGNYIGLQIWSGGNWGASWQPSRGKRHTSAIDDTPLKTLLKLTLKLHEEEIL